MSNKLVISTEQERILGFKKQVRSFRNEIFKSRVELMLIKRDMKKLPLSIDQYLTQKKVADLEHKIYNQELYVNIIDDVITKVVKTLNLDVHVEFLNK